MEDEKKKKQGFQEKLIDYIIPEWKNGYKTNKYLLKIIISY